MALTAPACPEPDQLVQFVDDALPAALRLTVEDHLDICDECRETVSVLARAAAAERRASQPAVIADGELTAETGGSALGLEATALAGATAVPSQPRLRRGPQSPLAPGTRIGRYVIGEPLGVGGMGIVYTARDPDLDRDIAIKILRPEFSRAHPDAAKRIVREAQAMARIAHPNVVAVFDVGTIDDRVFVAMERVSGTNLRGWLAREPRTPADILEVFGAAGRGLIAAHDAGMVHRDFKPDNVLVSDDGRVRVGDFGLAFDHEGGEAEDDGVDSVTRQVVGTPAYMAPEQHAGGNLDPRTDQFSFAVALYEALYKQRPFSGKTRDELAEAVQRGVVEAPPAKARVSSSLRAILLRGLAVRPGDRFPTMAQLLDALGRDRTRRPRQVAVVALVGLLLVGVAFVADLVTRERTTAITRTSFGATRGQLEKIVALRTEAFVAQTDALYRLPAVEEVVQSRDLVDFGLGDAADDRRRLQHLHDNLSSADWVELTRVRDSVLALADRKGRLLFGSANPAAWGGDVTTVPVLAAAYTGPSDTSIGVIDGSDPPVVTSGLLGGAARPGLHVLFTRGRHTAGPRSSAIIVQAIGAAKLLDEVSVGPDTELALLSPDGSVEGSVPRAVIDAATGDGIVDVEEGHRHWLVERTPLCAGDQHDTIAQLVLARATDVGLAGLFRHARIAFALLGVMFAALLVGGIALARARNLARGVT